MAGTAGRRLARHGRVQLAAIPAAACKAGQKDLALKLHSELRAAIATAKQRAAGNIQVALETAQRTKDRDTMIRLPPWPRPAMFARRLNTSENLDSPDM